MTMKSFEDVRPETSDLLDKIHTQALVEDTDEPVLLDLAEYRDDKTSVSYQLFVQRKVLD